MLRLFIRRDHDFVREHLTEHLLQRTIGVWGRKIQTNGLHSLDAQGSEKPLSQAASGGEHQAADKERSGDRGDPNRPPAPGKETGDKRDTFFPGTVPRSETRKGNLRIDAYFGSGIVESEKMSLYASGRGGDFLKTVPALRTDREVLLDFRTRKRIRFTVVISAQHALRNTIHRPSSGP